MSAIERLFQYFDYKGIKTTPAERNLGLSNGYLGKMRTRGASIGSEIVEKIVLFYPEISPEWLITGNGEMIRDEMSAKEPYTHYGTCKQCKLKDDIIDDKNEIIVLLKDKIRTLNTQLKTPEGSIQQTGS